MCSFHCDGKGGPGGFVAQLRPLGGDHKGFVSAVALTWISKLLKFGLVKKSFPMVYQLYTC